MCTTKQQQDEYQKPTLKDLCNLLTGVDWEELGVQLDIPTGILNDIKADNPSVAKKRMKVLETWLERDPTATIETLVEALKSPALQQHVLAERLNQTYMSKKSSAQIPIHVSAEVKECGNMIANPELGNESGTDKVMLLSQQVKNDVKTMTIKYIKQYIEKDPTAAGVKNSWNFQWITSAIIMVGITLTFLTYLYFDPLCTLIVICISLAVVLVVLVVFIYRDIYSKKKELTNTDYEELTEILMNKMYSSFEESKTSVLCRKLPLMNIPDEMVEDDCINFLDTCARLTVRGDIEEIRQLTKQLTNDVATPCEIKALAYVFEACTCTFTSSRQPINGAVSFAKALTLSHQKDCNNPSFIQGIVFAYAAQLEVNFGHPDVAKLYLHNAKSLLHYYEPNNESGQVPFVEALLLIQETDLTNQKEKNKIIDLLDMSAKHNQHGKRTDYRTTFLLSFKLINKALVHMNCNVGTLELQTQDSQPNEIDVQNALSSLKAVPQTFIKEKEPSSYKTIYYFALAECYRFCKKNQEAINNYILAKNEVKEGNFCFHTDRIDQRLSLLQTSKRWVEIVDSHAGKQNPA